MCETYDEDDMKRAFETGWVMCKRYYQEKLPEMLRSSVFNGLTGTFKSWIVEYNKSKDE